MIDGSPTSREISLGSEVCLPDSATATQLCQRFHQLRTAPVNCSELHQQPVDAVLRPVFVQKLLYSVKHSCLLKGVKVVHLLYIASKFALFSVSDLKDEKLTKKQTYIKTEACKL